MTIAIRAVMRAQQGERVAMQAVDQSMDGAVVDMIKHPRSPAPG